MADERVVETADEQLARVTRELDDLRSTVMARLSTRPTGDIEPTVRSVAKTGTLLLQGQDVNRVDYPVLWQWVNDQGLLVAGLFDIGNGTTTFGLPDFRGRVPVGAGTLGADTYALGATGGSSTKTLLLANMPVHDHNVGVSGASSGSSGSHAHSGTTGNSGNHGGHTAGTTNVVPPGSGVTLPASYNNFPGDHSHGFGTDSQGTHSHTVSVTINESSMGSGTAFDARQAYIAINWMIYA